VQVRDYKQSDAAAITRLFYETVRSINLQDYSLQQVEAWAPSVPGPDIWHSRMKERCTLVAEENGEIIAFTELERDGHLDMFYCRRDVIRRGVGRLLYEAIELKAAELGLGRIFTDASITARPFFEHCGFITLRMKTVTRGGIELSNFRMEKRLAAPIEAPPRQAAPQGISCTSLRRAIGDQSGDGEIFSDVLEDLVQLIGRPRGCDARGGPSRR
jgi:GNAT superfamily N-acetyltransferase